MTVRKKMTNCLLYGVMNTFILCLKLNPNGFVSFGSRFQSSWVRRMNNRHLTQPMLALYWYDLDPSWTSNLDDSGKLYYHIYESKDTSILSRINKLVVLKLGDDQFKAAWALVATWDHVRPWPNLKTPKKYVLNFVFVIIL